MDENTTYFFKSDKTFASPIAEKDAAGDFAVEVYAWSTDEDRHVLSGFMYHSTAVAIHGECDFR
jgi:hypothetical protein